ncbi:MAG TPA: hypothetical protein VF081_10735 [Solirubrobacterales bacterium]
MSGGSLLILVLVQLALTAMPGVAAALVAIRLGAREVPLVLCAGLVGSGVSAMLTFWLYWGLPSLGPACAYALFFGSVAAAIWLWPRVASTQRDLLRRLSVPLGLWMLACLFVVFLGFFGGGADSALLTGAARFGTNPTPFATDSSIPLFFSEWIFAGSPGPAPLFEPGWLLADRPPLQIGYVLAQRDFGWDTATLHYQLLGVMIQQLWVIGMWALLSAARVARRTRVLVMIAALVSDVAIVNSFYVWPKLLGAAFILAALALVVDPRGSTLKRAPWTIVLFGALAGLAFLSHGTSSFGLIPLAAIAIWRGLPGWRWLAVGAASLLLLVLPWVAYQSSVDPPGNRLVKWSLAGVVEIDDRGTFEAIADEYGAAGLSGTLDNKLSNFETMLGGNPADSDPPPGQFPFGDVVHESGDLVSALADGEFETAISKAREIKHWHLLWMFGLLLLALPAILVGRLRAGWQESDEWRFARFCLLVYGIGVVCFGLLMFGNVAGRAIATSSSLALPLVGIAGLVAGLRATFPRWADWLVGANVLSVLVVYTPYLGLPVGRSYSTFAALVFLGSLAAFLALSSVDD